MLILFPVCFITTPCNAAEGAASDHAMLMEFAVHLTPFPCVKNIFLTLILSHSRSFVFHSVMETIITLEKPVMNLFLSLSVWLNQLIFDLVWVF